MGQASTRWRRRSRQRRAAAMAWQNPAPRGPVVFDPSLQTAARLDLELGLPSSQAAARLARDGPNRLPAARRPTAARRLAGQLLHFFAVMLWVAGAFAFLAGLPELGVAIFVVIVVNAVFAFVQESRADRAAERLHSLLPRRVTVRRDGRRREIDAEEVVVGDLLALESGDRVPADAVLVVAHSLLVDTSTFTGESEPSTIEEGPLFAGTYIVEGEADAWVTANRRSDTAGGHRPTDRADREPVEPAHPGVASRGADGGGHRRRCRRHLLPSRPARSGRCSHRRRRRDRGGGGIGRRVSRARGMGCATVAPRLSTLPVGAERPRVAPFAGSERPHR